MDAAIAAPHANRSDLVHCHSCMADIPSPARTARPKLETSTSREFFNMFRKETCCTIQCTGPRENASEKTARVQRPKNRAMAREDFRKKATGAATKAIIAIYDACSGMSSPAEFFARAISLDTSPPMLHSGTAGQGSLRE